MNENKILAIWAAELRKITRIPKYDGNFRNSARANLLVLAHFPDEIRLSVWALYPSHVDYIERRCIKLRDDARMADSNSHDENMWPALQNGLLDDILNLADLAETLAGFMSEKDKDNRPHLAKRKTLGTIVDLIYENPGDPNNEQLARIIGNKSAKAFSGKYGKILKSLGFSCSRGTNAGWSPPKKITSDQVKKRLKKFESE